MRFSTTTMLAATAALAAVPAVAAAAPLRAGASLPVSSSSGRAIAERAATPMEDESQLRGGFPLIAFVGLFGLVALIVIVAGSGGGRSPG